MTTKPEIAINETEVIQNTVASTPSKQAIYPEVSSRFKGIILWLGLAFVLMVFLIQQISGYS